MEWMLNNQEGRRNLTAVDRLLAAEKLREKISEEARLKKEETDKKFYGNRFTNDLECRPSGQDSTKETKIHTRKELAKIAGVGEGTVQRFDKVMKSGDDELIQKVRSGEKTTCDQMVAGYKSGMFTSGTVRCW